MGRKLTLGISMILPLIFNAEMNEGDGLRVRQTRSSQGAVEK
jgi:hypothetical protein